MKQELIKSAALAPHIVDSFKTVPEREYRRQIKNRQERFRRAVEFAYKMDWPITVLLTVSWDALIEAGEHNEGHCLGKPPRERERYLRSELYRICRENGLTFAAFWARDIGVRMGSHVHIEIFFPTRWLHILVGHIQRISGSSAAFVNPPYFEAEISEYMKCVAARSVCGGWQIDLNSRELAGARYLAEYIAGQDEKHPKPVCLEGKAFGVSRAIGKSAQDAHNPQN